jgi:hypothetical protein
VRGDGDGDGDGAAPFTHLPSVALRFVKHSLDRDQLHDASNPCCSCIVCIVATRQAASPSKGRLNESQERILAEVAEKEALAEAAVAAAAAAAAAKEMQKQHESARLLSVALASAQSRCDGHGHGDSGDDDGDGDGDDDDSPSHV